MSRECDSLTSKIELFEKEKVTPKMKSLLKYHFENHCKGKNPSDGVGSGYVKELLSNFEYVVIATAKNHMGTRSKSVEKLCGFLFLRKVKDKYAYIDLVCSSDKIGWKLLDFAEDWVHAVWKLDVMHLSALSSVKCMYAFRGYREVPPSQGCKLKVKPSTVGNERDGYRMSKCVTRGKQLTTNKSYPKGCDSRKNRQIYKNP